MFFSFLKSTKKRPEKQSSEDKPLVLEPVAPNYSDILIKESDIDMVTLALKFGDKYRESYCTPRTITINLSEELEANNDRFFLVLVLKSGGGDVAWCR